MAQSKSHMLPMIAISKELEKLNHSVTFAVASRMNTDLINDGFNISTIIAKSLDQFYFEDIIREMVETMMSGAKITALADWLKGTNALCHGYLNDTAHVQELAAQHFNYAIVDYAPTLCFSVMAYKLNLPFISLGAFIDPSVNRVPFNPSFMPTLFSSFNDKMTFLERIINTVRYLILLLRPSVPSFENLSERYVPEKQSVSNEKIKQMSLMYIADNDMLLEFPHPVPSNVIMCGGLAATSAIQLPKKLNDFVGNSSDGIVVVSFGSIIKTLPTKTLSKMLEAFNMVTNLNFVVATGKEVKHMKNILMLPWIPQNDLLGHSKTKLFITHGGKSSVFEALHHGIPMIVFPIGVDQPANAAVITSKHYGLTMDFYHFTIQNLVENIRNIAVKGQFKSNITRASAIFHSRPQTPPERAAYWINLVTKYGNEHFRHSSLDMHWYSFYLIDIIITFITIGFSSVICLQWMCCRVKRKHKQE
ncbi:UGT [Mytilus coruscus]|uniref:UDP-glucuronosyltransferase n=1 Tax=Mytilus coruscus TaxID=42192 RepID=A0A6J8ACX1_MYTCO|nr:UGT [Mytilus coruscus]